MSIRYVVTTSMSAYESLGINSQVEIKKGKLLLHTLCCPALRDLNQKCVGVCICLCHPTRRKNKCKTFDIENIYKNIIKNIHGYVILTQYSSSSSSSSLSSSSSSSLSDSSSSSSEKSSSSSSSVSFSLSSSSSSSSFSVPENIFRYEDQIEALTVNEGEFVTFYADFTSILGSNYIESFYVTAKDYLDKNAPEIIESSRIADDINNNYIEVVINDETKDNKSPYTLDVYITDSVLENYSIRVWLYVLKV